MVFKHSSPQFLCIKDDIYNGIDVCNVHFIISIDIGTFSSLVIYIAAKDNINDGIDVSNINLTIMVYITRQIGSLNNVNRTGGHVTSINCSRYDNTYAITDSNNSAISYHANRFI